MDSDGGAKHNSLETASLSRPASRIRLRSTATTLTNCARCCTCVPTPQAPPHPSVKHHRSSATNTTNDSVFVVPPSSVTTMHGASSSPPPATTTAGVTPPVMSTAPPGIPPPYQNPVIEANTRMPPVVIPNAATSTSLGSQVSEPAATTGLLFTRDTNNAAFSPATAAVSSPHVTTASVATTVAASRNTTTHTGALRFTCCRCRRSLVVQPEEHCSSCANLFFKRQDSVRRGRSDNPILAPHSGLERRVTAAVEVTSSSTSKVAPFLQAAVVASFKTSGTGQRYRPLEPQSEQRCGGVSRNDADCGVQTSVGGRLLLDALLTDTFTPGEGLTDTQLKNLLTETQRTFDRNAQSAPCSSLYAFANPHTFCDAAHSLGDSSALRFSTAHSAGSVCLAQRSSVNHHRQQHSCLSTASTCIDDYKRWESIPLAVLDLLQLTNIGVRISNSSDGFSSLKNSRRGDNAAETNEQHNTEQWDVAEAHRGDSSSTTKSSRTGGGSPDLAALRTLFRTSSEGDVITNQRNQKADSHWHNETPNTVMSSEACSFEEPVAICPVVEKNTVMKNTGINSSNIRTAAEGASLPFDEVCRRWMRLLVHSASTLHALPLCLECWSEACLVPLQQLTKNALEGVDGLDAALQSSCSGENSRLWTLICEVPTKATTSVGVSSLHDNAWPWCIQKKTEQPSISPALSLDAVAANTFGALETEWLNTMTKLSAPHQQLQWRSADAVRTEKRLSANNIHNTATPLVSNRGAEDKPNAFESSVENETALQERYAELNELREALQEVQAQQAALDAQKRELQDVLDALSTTTTTTRIGIRSVRSSHASSGDCMSDASTETHKMSNTPSFPTPTMGGIRTNDCWAALAAAHNISEVQAAFTQRDEAAERRHSSHDLFTRHAFLCATSIDALCFPVDVSGPIGTIAGLRLGLVPPYTGSGTTGGVTTNAVSATHTTSPAQRNHFSSNRLDSLVHNTVVSGNVLQSVATSCSPTAEEAVHLEGFLRRQVQYTQLLLSGNTIGTRVDDLEHFTDVGGSTDALEGNSSNGSSITGAKNTSNVRVSVAEVNAACGYLLLLVGYLAQVNGFSFQTALLRPAGDRSTVALLKRVSRCGACPSSATSAVALTNPTATPMIPFSFFGLFTNPSVSTGSITPAAATAVTANTMTPTAASAWPSLRSSYTVDYEVDFYITDRLFAWRTFGTACVAVASCVRELCDALHESLRCWRLRESMMRRHPREEEKEKRAEEALHASRNIIATTSTTERIRKTAATSVSCGYTTTPVSFPRFLGVLNEGPRGVSTAAAVSDISEEVSSTPRTPHDVTSNGSDKSTNAKAVCGSDCTATAPATVKAAAPSVSQFPLHPPYRIQNDTVDGFSVRHGNVTDAIWTLGMKKLLADVQWCMGATVELERLYAITGEGDNSDSGKVQGNL